MRTTPRRTLKQLQASLLGVLEVCPAEQCNPQDCPLCELRKLPHQERLRWIESLSEGDLNYLTVYHYVCMNAKRSSSTARGRARA